MYTSFYAAGFVPYAGEGYALLLPSKWNPSKEKDFAGVDLRYEDNFDAVNNVVVIKKKSDKNSVTDYGSADKFLADNAYLFGDQSYKGDTLSEGGFAQGKVSAASLLDIKENVDQNGKKYYLYELLVRTGTEMFGEGCNVCCSIHTCLYDQSGLRSSGPNTPANTPTNTPTNPPHSRW